MVVAYQTHSTLYARSSLGLSVMFLAVVVTFYILYKHVWLLCALIATWVWCMASIVFLARRINANQIAEREKNKMATAALLAAAAGTTESQINKPKPTPAKKAKKVTS